MRGPTGRRRPHRRALARAAGSHEGGATGALPSPRRGSRMRPRSQRPSCTADAKCAASRPRGWPAPASARAGSASTTARNAFTWGTSCSAAAPVRAASAGTTHPARVAGEIAMLDHMLDGRLNFGISPGGLPSDAEAFGTFGKDRNAMFVEGSTRCCRSGPADPPYNIEGKFWSVTTREDADRRYRPGHHPQAAAVAASADHRDGGGPVLQRGHGGGVAR